jgi:hypothetical protein
MFQIVRLELNRNGDVIVRQPLQPQYDLWEDAAALAEFDASRCNGPYGYDEEHDCWCASEAHRSYRFVIESTAPDEGWTGDLDRAASLLRKLEPLIALLGLRGPHPDRIWGTGRGFRPPRSRLGGICRRICSGLGGARLPKRARE